jgi:hypothetical protein
MGEGASSPLACAAWISIRGHSGTNGNFNFHQLSPWKGRVVSLFYTLRSSPVDLIFVSGKDVVEGKEMEEQRYGEGVGAMEDEKRWEGDGDGDGVREDVEVGEGGEEEEDELAQAARAGIRLLEENSQLQDEVQHLQAQLAHAEGEKGELSRLLEERDLRIDKLSAHLRESIRESQSVAAELAQAKQRLDGYQQLIQAQAAAASAVQRSPGKPKRQATSPWKAKVTQLSVMTDLDAGSSGLRSTINAGSTPTARQVRSSSDDREDLAAQPHSPLMRSASDSSRHNQQSEVDDRGISRVTASIPAQKQTLAALKETEAMVADEQRRNGVLKMELSSAHKQIIELKTHHAKLQETRTELETKRTEMMELEQQLEAAREERSEERELIHSLRSTIEVYQSLDHPLRSSSSRVDGSSKEGLRRRSSGTRITNALDIAGDCGADQGGPSDGRRAALMHRRRSDGCVLPPSAMSMMDNQQSSLPILDDRYNLRDENDRLVNELDHLSKQVLNMKLQGGFARVSKTVTFKEDTVPIDGEVSQSDHAKCVVGPVGLGGNSRMLQSEQQLAVLQDLLKRFRSQWKHERNVRRSAECEKMQLLGRMEKMQIALGRRCTACHQASNDELADDFAPWDVSAPVYKTFLDGVVQCESNNEQGDELESICFAILHRLVDSWTTDSGKRMQLHDWLMNAIRGTGKEKPLYLFDLSSEIATGFQALMSPILSEKFGVHVQVEKRLRHVITTDLKLQVIDRNPDKAKACQQRIGRSLLWLSDVDTSWVERTEWVGDFVRRRNANSCSGL